MQSGTKITSLNLGPELVNKAQDFGLNLLKWVNFKLKEFFYGGFTPSNRAPNDCTIAKELVVRMSPQFKAWLVANRNDKRYIASLENYLTKYFTGLILNSPQNIIEYISKIKTTSKYPILALRLYIKFLEEVGQITSEQGIQLERVLKVKKSKPDNYVPTDDRIREVFSKLNDERDKLFFQILAYSGARTTEMSRMLSEFYPQNLVKHDTFARYTLNYKRGQKNSFYIYIPIEVANSLKRFSKGDSKAITKLFGVKTRLTPKYLRKWFYNKVIMAGIPESVADLYEGRSPATVGSSNYLGKTQQADHWYKMAMETLKHTISL